jgi:hypothetical protein
MEWRIRALGGMGDAGYAAGRLVTSRRCFIECVKLADDEGLLRVATANRPMIGDCELYFLEVHKALGDAEAALAGARQLGDRYLEMFALQSRAHVQWCAEHEEAAVGAEQALTVSRALRSDRYTYMLLVTLASAAGVRMSSAERMALCREALELAERTSLTFAGPLIYAVTAQCEPDPSLQREWIRRGEELLPRSPLAHNQILFPRLAIDWAIARRDWDEVRRFAEQLRAFCAAREPVPYVDLVVDRAVTLADLAARPGDPVLVERLRGLRDHARGHDLRFSFPLPD